MDPSKEGNLPERNDKVINMEVDMTINQANPPQLEGQDDPNRTGNGEEYPSKMKDQSSNDSSKMDVVTN